MASLTLTRSYSDYMVDEPLTWKPLGTPSGQKASVVCVNGHAGTIIDHSIDDDGTVHPSVVCATDGCTWHEFIHLQGWTNG